MKTIYYNKYKNHRKFWKDVLSGVNNNEKIEILTEFEDYNNLPGDLDFLIMKAKNAERFELCGGCSLSLIVRNEIILNKFAMLMSKITETIEIKVVKKILNENYFVSLYLNDDAQVSFALEKQDTI